MTLRRSRFSILDTSPLDNERGLVGWWPFDNGQGTDFSGNQNNVFASGTPVFQNSEMGNAYGFTTGNFFQVSTLGAGNPIATNAVTVSTWLKPNVLTRGDIISVWAGDGSGTDQFNLLYGLDSGKPTMFCFNGGVSNNSASGTTTMATGIWYHVAGTFGDGNVAVYLNGKLEASTVQVGSLGSGATNPILVGASGSGGSNLLNGSLADPRVYNRVLSGQEINDLYSRGIPRFQLSPDEWEMPIIRSTQKFLVFRVAQDSAPPSARMIGY